MSGVPDKIMAQSHTSLSCYVTCPRQYEAKYITKEVVFEQGEAAAWGDAVHQALEGYVRDGVPLPSNVEMYKKWGDAIRLRAGVKVIEGSFAVRRDLTPCDFRDPDAWLRAYLDVLILRANVADILDYKTGKQKNDPTQLRRYALLVFAKYPEIDTIKCGYIWLKDDVLSKPVVYYRHQMEDMVRIENDLYAQIEDSYTTGSFQPKPSGLCNGWCPVTSCKFWKPKRT